MIQHVTFTSVCMHMRQTACRSIEAILESYLVQYIHSLSAYRVSKPGVCVMNYIVLLHMQILTSRLIHCHINGLNIYRSPQYCNVERNPSITRCLDTTFLHNFNTWLVLYTFSSILVVVIIIIIIIIIIILYFVMTLICINILPFIFDNLYSMLCMSTILVAHWGWLQSAAETC